MTRLINIDNGGTFTDVCVSGPEGVRYTKTPTTPSDLGQCLSDALAKTAALISGSTEPGVLLDDDTYIRYATTQATHALHRLHGPALGLLAEPDPHAGPRPLPERLAADDTQREVLDALVGDRFAAITVHPDDTELERHLAAHAGELIANGATSLVVSVGGPDGAARERRVRESLLRLYPRHVLGAVPLAFSWELAADPDDVRRTWTCLLNAFLHAETERLLCDAERRLGPLLIYRNDGCVSRLGRLPALRTCGAGARGGLEGTRALAKAYHLDHALMLDSGGSTTETGVVSGRELPLDRRARIGGIPTSLELAAITSHGIGGGSVLRVAGGAITVGPDSVGGVPGPACFGRGGIDATITDVLLLRGVLHPGTFLDGTSDLDVAGSAKVVTANIADPLGLRLDEALARAEDAYTDGLARQLRAMRPGTDTVIVAFGGAGPMLACVAARKAGVRRVLVPRTAAVFSAFGIGFSDLAQTYEHPLPSIDEAVVDGALRGLRERAHRELRAEGLTPGAERVRLHVWGADGTDTVPWDQRGRAAGAPGVLELGVVVPLEHVRLGTDVDGYASSAVRAGSRTVRGHGELPVFGLPEQEGGAYAAGPAVLEGPYFTMWVPEDWEFQTTMAGDLLLTDRSVPVPR